MRKLPVRYCYDPVHDVIRTADAQENTWGLTYFEIPRKTNVEDYFRTHYGDKVPYWSKYRTHIASPCAQGLPDRPIKTGCNTNPGRPSQEPAVPEPCCPDLGIDPEDILGCGNNRPPMPGTLGNQPRPPKNPPCIVDGRPGKVSDISSSVEQEVQDGVYYKRREEKKKPQAKPSSDAKPEEKEEDKGKRETPVGEHGKYEWSRKHPRRKKGQKAKPEIYDSRGELISWAPDDGQNALNNSVPESEVNPAKEGSKARVGVDNDEVVILPLTGSNIYHGYVPYDHQLDPDMVDELIKRGLFGKK